ncbi:MAG: hypothetical protein JW827_00045 [Spirochaetes bacterium]|nr:hypothetical protein [Spirochaetota bacterium]
MLYIKKKLRYIRKKGDRIRILAGLFSVLLFLLLYRSVLISDNFKLHKPGTENIIDYSKYGKFKNLDNPGYRYVITKRKELLQAVGEGIYPSTSVFKDPEYKKLLKQGKLEGNHWKFVDTKAHKINFYKWATTQEDPGVKQYYIGIMFERLGMLKEAIKAYHAVAVHFPKSISYTYWNSPFSVAQVALDRIEILCRRNPELGMKLVDSRIFVENGFDVEPGNDKFYINPGKIIRVSVDAVEKKKQFDKKDIVRTVGGKKVKLVRYKNGHWQLLVDEKPFIIKAIAYSPNKVGLSPDRGELDPSRDWQKQDFNKNDLVDGPFEAWVDKNFNNKQDKDEKPVGDAQLLKEMGCNTFRIYSHIVNKELFRELHKKYGFMVMIGDLVGGYATESGATWDEGTDYEDFEQQERMLKNVEKMVLEYKDEPYTLMWVLGNENVYGVANNADRKPEAFFKFINRVAKLVHKLDPEHPVAVANGDLKFLDICAKQAPEIDIFGCNAYRGSFGFGRALFQNVKELMDKPAIITEYGCSAYAEGFTEEDVLAFQAEYHKNNWEDIYFHTAGSGVGNALGGVVFEWVDEWWKANSDLPKRIQLQHKEWYETKKHHYAKLHHGLGCTYHVIVPQFGAPFLDGWSYEEWYGLWSQGDGCHSPYMRQKRPVYDMYTEVWNRIKP